MLVMLLTYPHMAIQGISIIGCVAFMLPDLLQHHILNYNNHKSSKYGCFNASLALILLLGSIINIECSRFRPCMVMLVISCQHPGKCGNLGEWYGIDVNPLQSKGVPIRWNILNIYPISESPLKSTSLLAIS